VNATNWKQTRLGNELELLYGKGLPASARVPGGVPVYGSNGVVGLHHKSLVDGPGIIVGRKGSVGEVAFSDGPFWPIDTTYYVSNRGGNSWRFLYFLLRHLELTELNSHSTVPGLNRESVYSIEWVFPPKDEQEKIAAVLWKIQKTVEIEDAIVRNAHDLKKSLLRRLFTHGLRGEPLKETEGGPIPQSWRVGTINDVKLDQKGAIVSGPFGSNIGRRFFVESGVPLIRGCNLTKGDELFVEENFVFITEEKAQELKSCQALPGDLIFTAAGTLGQVGLIPRESQFPKYVISNKQLRARIDPAKADSLYLFYWFACDVIQELIAQRRSGSSIPVINLSILRSLPIPLPQTIKEQCEIAQTLQTVDRMIDIHESKKRSLQDLFKTTLHKLMTAQICVSDLDIDTSEVNG